MRGEIQANLQDTQLQHQTQTLDRQAEIERDLQNLRGEWGSIHNEERAQIESRLMEEKAFWDRQVQDSQNNHEEKMWNARAEHDRARDEYNAMLQFGLSGQSARLTFANTCLLYTSDAADE